MRERPKNLLNKETGYTTREYMKWQADYSHEQLTDFMNKIGKDAFVKLGIEICNKNGSHSFKTEEDLFKFMKECPKAMKNYFDMTRMNT